MPLAAVVAAHGQLVNLKRLRGCRLIQIRPAKQLAQAWLGNLNPDDNEMLIMNTAPVRGRVRCLLSTTQSSAERNDRVTHVTVTRSTVVTAHPPQHRRGCARTVTVL